MTEVTYHTHLHQWLRLSTFIARAPGSNPGWGTTILQAMCLSLKTNYKKKKNPEIMRLFARLHKVSRKVTTITMSEKKSINLWIYRKKVGGTGVVMF